jgi:serine-type D-Ala-D-Ala carboxypeptidase/endopeptidase (penicillin-binding protein 4)
MRPLRVSLVALMTSALITSSVVTFTPVATAGSLHEMKLPRNFYRYATSRVLRNPGILIVDPATKASIYSKSPDEFRAPASVLKLFSMTAVLHSMSAATMFTTTLLETSKTDTFFLSGQSDPWLTSSPYEAKKYHRAYLPALVNSLLLAHPKLKSIKLQYFGLYPEDVKVLQRFFSGRVKIQLAPMTSTTPTGEQLKRKIGSIRSPALSKIVQFTLLYSDNRLADKLVRIAAKKNGFPDSASGIRSVIAKTLTDLKISATGLSVQDGNGLSHATKVSVRQISDLLLAIRTNPELRSIYDGLPISGKTGTLKNRFRVDAPQAVGLIHAKTGWIDNTVSLAGYVNVGKRQYVFVVVANHIPNSAGDRQAARVAIDQMMGTIARRGA